MYRITYIYLFIIREPTRCHAPTPRREWKDGKKRIEAQQAKPRPSIPANYALIDEEQTGKEERTKKETGNWSPTHLPWSLRSPPTTYRDHTVSLFWIWICILTAFRNTIKYGIHGAVSFHSTEWWSWWYLKRILYVVARKFVFEERKSFARVS